MLGAPRAVIPLVIRLGAEQQKKIHRQCAAGRSRSFGHRRNPLLGKEWGPEEDSGGRRVCVPVMQTLYTWDIGLTLIETKQCNFESRSNSRVISNSVPMDADGTFIHLWILGVLFFGAV